MRHPTRLQILLEGNGSALISKLDHDIIERRMVPVRGYDKRWNVEFEGVAA